MSAGIRKASVPFMIFFIVVSAVSAGPAEDQSSQIEQCRAPQVTMILPAREQNPFWGSYARFATVAAADLGVDFNVIFTEPNNRFDYMARFKSVT